MEVSSETLKSNKFHLFPHRMQQSVGNNPAAAAAAAAVAQSQQRAVALQQQQVISPFDALIEVKLGLYSS